VEGVLLDMGDTLIEEGPFLPGRSPLIPGVGETLPLLRRYRLGLVTNTEEAGRAEVSRALGLLGIGQYFSTIVTSSDLGWRKPHPLIFEAALASLGLPATRTVMVGNDLAKDVAGARALGMRTIHFRWSPRYPALPRGEEERPTLVMGDFVELPEALERLEAFPSPAPQAPWDNGDEHDL
jgi:HAD superfamily hydrolase (TIGR01509 family)